jgi:cytochrome c peroxidase
LFFEFLIHTAMNSSPRFFSYHTLLAASLLALALTIAASILFSSCAQPQTNAQTNAQTSVQQFPRAQRIQERFLGQVQMFADAVSQMDSLATLANTEQISLKNLQSSYILARRHYKTIEWFVEYAHPSTAHRLNGAPIEEYEAGESTPELPTGFQVLEDLMFPRVQAESFAEIQENTRLVKALASRLVQTAPTRQISDGHIFDAAQIHVWRMITLGITGFDAPVRLCGVQDAEQQLAEYTEIIAPYRTDLRQAAPLLDSTLTAILTESRAFIARNADFATFDRAVFIAEYANPLSDGIAEAREALHIAQPQRLRALAASARTLFDSAAMDPYFFAPEYAKNASPEQRRLRSELGRLLFFDPVLSGSGERACASCHQPERAFTDGNEKSIAFSFKGEVRRNAPTIINAAMQNSLFADARVAFLEDQANDVVNAANEMHGSMKQAVERLRGSAEYMQLFQQAFSDTGKSSKTNNISNLGTLTELNIKMALASYERSLLGMNSRFDRFMRGERQMLSTKEQHGFNLFMGKAKCGTCHFMPFFNGSVPPMFDKTEWEIIGVPAHARANARANARAHKTRIDADSGRVAVEGIEAHRFAFKTPTVRNAALTAPYMHNGVYASLTQVMDFYNRGGGKGMGIPLASQTLSEENLRLSRGEQQDIIAFMAALTDTVGCTTRPARLPQFSQSKAISTRRVGGLY